MATIKIGIGVPGASSGIPVVEAARYIEKLELDSLWAPDLIIGDGTPALESALTLAAAASVTDRVGIGFGVLTVPLRPAAWLAAQIATLQHLSNDRVLLGVGSGGFPDSPFWQGVGVPGRERGRRTDETLRALPALLSGEPTRLGADTPPMTLRPTAPVPPVLVGGNSEVAMRRAVEYGGWFPSLIASDDLAVAVARLRDRAEALDRPMPSVTVGGHLILGDDESARSAREGFVRNLIGVHRMPAEMAARIPMIARNAEELAEVFAAYRAAGADRVVTGPDNGDWKAGLQVMAEARALLD